MLDPDQMALLMKPADLDLKCSQKRINPGSTELGLNFGI